MKKKKKVLNENSRILATKLIHGVLTKNNKVAEKALTDMINNRISMKIKKVMQNENLIN